MHHRVQFVYTTKTNQLMFKKVNAIQNYTEPVHVSPCIRVLTLRLAGKVFTHKCDTGNLSALIQC